MFEAPVKTWYCPNPKCSHFLDSTPTSDPHSNKCLMCNTPHVWVAAGTYCYAKRLGNKKPLDPVTYDEMERYLWRFDSF